MVPTEARATTGATAAATAQTDAEALALAALGAEGSTPEPPAAAYLADALDYLDSVSEFLDWAPPALLAEGQAIKVRGRVSGGVTRRRVPSRKRHAPGPLNW